jgi:hypothetical protein
LAASGLCYEITQLYEEGRISIGTMATMRRRIDQLLEERDYDFDCDTGERFDVGEGPVAYLFPPYEASPRIALARKLSLDTKGVMPNA